MGSQSSKVPRSDLTAKEAADASPSKRRQPGPLATPSSQHPLGRELRPRGEGVPQWRPPRRGRISLSKKWPVLKRNWKEGGGDLSGEMAPCSKEGTAQEGKAVATPQSQEHQAKGAEASATSKGGGTEEAGPEVAEPSTPSGPEGGRTPASEQNE
ncbi:hypothetical protein FD754_013171 [Muntiacus muntjak]|uniref:Uncharacterized protein n=1 Tax=Muntiacus muntjak TaxID=9888 RepID=A0A5N3VGU0_MUNMU|nr:hypothetical protein FD754_013171 [Muntiacus muntjak]